GLHGQSQSADGGGEEPWVARFVPVNIERHALFFRLRNSAINANGSIHAAHSKSEHRKIRAWQSRLRHPWNSGRAWDRCRSAAAGFPDGRLPTLEPGREVR